MKVDILRKNLRFPEGPIIDEKGDIYLVELRGGSLVKIDRRTMMTERIFVNGSPNGLMVLNENELVFCDAELNCLRKFNKRVKFHKSLL